jgi:hypothetical protein
VRKGDERDAEVVRESEVGVDVFAKLTAEEDLTVKLLVVVDALLDLRACLTRNRSVHRTRKRDRGWSDERKCLNNP